MTSTLRQRLLAEYVGTLFLTAAVIGSGIAAVRLSPGDVGVQLLENALITGAVLVALILTFQPVSAAFNPVVSAVGAALGDISWREAGLQSLAQVAGCVSGAVLANVMFDLPAVTVSDTERSGGHLLVAEMVATVGLLLVVFVAARLGRGATIAVGVAGYITAAYWFTSSTSFANPAITVARTLSDSFAGIAPSSVPGFVVAQLVGAVIALGLVLALTPTPVPRPVTSEGALS